MNSGWLPGGHNQTDECKKLVAADIAGNPGTEITLLPGGGRRCDEPGAANEGMCEDLKQGIVVQYRYVCRGTLRSGPIYSMKQSPACGLWN